VEDKHKVASSTPGLSLGTPDTGFAVGAGGDHLLPIYMELRVIECTLDTILPTLAGWYGSDKINALFLAINQLIDFHVSFIDQMNVWLAVFR
jgi:hypothetical protein